MKRWLVILAVVTSGVAGAYPRHVFTFHFLHEGESYSLHVVVPHFLAQRKNDLDDFISDLLKASPTGNVSQAWRRTDIAHFLQSWVIQHYKDIGLLPKDSDASLELALNRTSYFDIERSAAVFVTPRNSKNILALIRIDSDTQDISQLGIEQFLIELGKPSVPFSRAVTDDYVARPEKNDFRLIYLPDDKFQFGWVRHTAVDEKYIPHRPSGAASEILNFNRVNGSPDFLPLLYLSLDAFGLSKWSGKLTPSGNGTQELVGVDNYYMHCEGEGRRTYFEKIGWIILDSYANPHFKKPDGAPITNYVLTISRAAFKNSLEQFFTRRETFSQILLSRFELDPSLSKQVRCQRILAARRTYPVSLPAPLRTSRPRP